jgi:hypothetical protein
MITECASEILLVTYAPAELPDRPIERAIGRVAERLSQFASASAIRMNICA